ncbi:MAG: TSUP family transporter [Hyphomicrobium sp.]
MAGTTYTSPMDFDVIALLMLAAMAAGFIDAIAGGGGLITLPALLLAGASPLEALATNKLQGTFGVGAASLNFWRGGHIDLSRLRVPILTTALGAAIGASLAQTLPTGVLKAVMPVALIAVAIYFAVAPRLAKAAELTNAKPQDRVDTRLSLTLAFATGALGFYDGIFGPGTGSFMTLALVIITGLGLVGATAHAKILNFTSNIASLAVFVAGGHILYGAGFAMAFGQACGGWLGSSAAMRHGARVIRPLAIAVALAIALRLLIDDANPLWHWMSARPST